MIGIKTLRAFRQSKADRTEPEGVHKMADTYWTILLLIGAIAIVANISFGMRQLFVPPPQEEVGPTVGEGAATLDQAQLKATLEALQDRQSKFEALSH